MSNNKCSTVSNRFNMFNTRDIKCPTTNVLMSTTGSISNAQEHKFRISSVQVTLSFRYDGLFTIRPERVLVALPRSCSVVSLQGSMHGASSVLLDFSRRVGSSVLSGSLDAFGGSCKFSSGGSSFVRFKWTLFRLYEESSAVSTSYDLSSSLPTITPFFHSFCPSVTGFILTVSPSLRAGRSWSLLL